MIGMKCGGGPPPRVMKVVLPAGCPPPHRVMKVVLHAGFRNTIGTRSGTTLIKIGAR